MKNADMPAMPCQPLGQDGMPSWEMTCGLTKREMFAMHFMSASISTGNTYNGFIEDSISYADSLLDKLEQTK